MPKKRVANKYDNRPVIETKSKNEGRSDDPGEIVISGARVHNLKNINLRLSRNKLIVVTGLSGSGKSSLAFDTIYAEGQRRYVESLSAYARQFLGRANKPEVDFIRGIPPSIAIEQRVNTRNPRSTVGTSTEIYDYLKLLYARIGQTWSPVSGSLVKKDTISDVVDHICSFAPGKKILILSPLKDNTGLSLARHIEDLMHQGITRLEVDGAVISAEEFFAASTDQFNSGVNVIVDRIVVALDDDSKSRYADSVQMAFRLGEGVCLVKEPDRQSSERYFSDSFEADGMLFEEPSVHMFSFNNPIGACPLCEGYGKVIGIDEDLVIPNKALSVYEDAIFCWKGEKMQKWKNRLVMNAEKFDFPIHRPYYELTDEQRHLLWSGNKYFKGLNTFFDYLETKKYKIQYRVMLSRYRGKTVCPQCMGTRLKKEANYVKINGKSITDLVMMPVLKLKAFFDNIRLNSYEEKIAGRVLQEINARIGYLCDVGLDYLTLNRLSSTLSGGESQRINLSATLGSSLVGSLYILDEPSIGLHPRDTNRLINVLKNLRDIGNTVMVVEHEEEIIRASDDIVDIGPFAGRHGGEIVYHGSYREFIREGVGLTADFLNGRERIEVPGARRKWNNFIEVHGASENNLKGFNVKIPLNVLTVITGVSGSGKSSLVKSIIYPALNKLYNGFGEKTGHFMKIDGDTHLLSSVEFVDQNPIGKSSRSNPVTYCKAFDDIRKLFASQQLSKYNGFTPSHFSFNIDGGRCEECQGEGEIKVEMQFMADVHLVCESCHGKRFKDEILEVTYQGRNIHDILELTVDEAIALFSAQPGSLEKSITKKLLPLAEVGLGYVQLGQSSSTLSGGESQRVKLASFLGAEKSKGSALFIFDEPTTGLHFHDIRKLLDAFHALIKRGHSVLIIEHNPEVIKTADWLIDLGPEGGEEGGYIVFEGIPEDIVDCERSYTGSYLRKKLGRENLPGSDEHYI
ncbi:MAG: excinuclease ABC subunit UvrA [Bacteroidales bacterium]|nr:excinuclease ABC subunit UvrA [Bacteroidales bacterium]